MRHMDMSTSHQLSFDDVRLVAAFGPRTMMLPRCAHLLVLLAVLRASHGESVQVVGNLAVVAWPQGHIGTAENPVFAQIENLWCGVNKLAEKVPVEYGEFTRLRDGKVFEGVIQNGKSFLEIGKAPVTVFGKYRCEVRTVEKRLFSGLLSVYLPPVLIFDKATKAREINETRPPHVIGVERRGLEGEVMTLECPILAYPDAMIRWQKDNTTIVPDDNTSYDGNSLILSPLTQQHVGSYRCIADNSFPLFVDGPSMPHQLVYDQEVKIL